MISSRTRLESTPKEWVGEYASSSVRIWMRSCSTSPMTCGECVVAMNWQRGKVSVSLRAIYRCHLGYRCRSISSISTTAPASPAGSISSELR